MHHLRSQPARLRVTPKHARPIEQRSCLSSGVTGQKPPAGGIGGMRGVGAGPLITAITHSHCHGPTGSWHPCGHRGGGGIGYKGADLNLWKIG